MAVDIKQAHRRLIEEAFGKGNVEAFDAVCDPGYRSHDPVTGDADLRQAKESCRMYRAAFPDLKPTLLSTCAEGEVVVTQWRMSGTHQKALLGIEPTGARCTVEGMTMGRFRAGKLVEEWSQWDALGLLRQLGAAPSLKMGEAGRMSEQRPHV
jgi:predicted ester cyclase